MFVAGKCAASTDPTDQVESEIAIVRQPTTVSSDLGARNEDVRISRSQAIKSRTPRPGRTPLTAAETFKELHDDIIQLRDLVSHIDVGRIQHLNGLSALLRKMICRSGTNDPILQRCAGLLNLPLIVYSKIPSAQETANDPPTWSFSSHIRVSRDHPNDTALDLDLWLTAQCVELGGEQYDNETVLRAIADTTGAHSDPDWDPLVGLFGRAPPGEYDRAKIRTTLQNYFRLVAEAVLVLGERVLGRAGGTTL